MDFFGNLHNVKNSKNEQTFLNFDSIDTRFFIQPCGTAIHIGAINEHNQLKNTVTINKIKKKKTLKGQGL